MAAAARCRRLGPSAEADKFGQDGPDRLHPSRLTRHSGKESSDVTMAALGSTGHAPRFTVEGRIASLLAVLAPTIAVAPVCALLGSRGVAFVVGIAFAATITTAAFISLRARPELVAASLLLWLSCERLVIAGLSPFLTETSLKLALAYKELFFPILLLITAPALLRRWRESSTPLRLTDGLAIAFGVRVLVAALTSGAPVMDRIVYARRLVLLPLVYMVGRLLPWTPQAARSALKYVVIAGVGVAAFGLVERFLFGGAIWRQLIPAAYYYHMSDLAGLSASGTDFPVDGLPITFFDFTTGVAARRVVSTFLEATTLASFLALTVVVGLAAYRPRLISLAGVVLMALALVLTLGKAGIAVAVVGAVYVAGVALVPRFRDPAWLASAAVGIVGAIVVIAIALEVAGSNSGALAHFRGLQDGIASAVTTPFGLGLGVGGDFGSGSAAAESTFGVLLVQLGFPGLILWTAWILALAVQCATGGIVVARTGLAGYGVAIALVGFYATAAVTESAGGLIGNWPYAFLAAALVTAGALDARRTVRLDIPGSLGAGEEGLVSVEERGSRSVIGRRSRETLIALVLLPIASTALLSVVVFTHLGGLKSTVESPAPPAIDVPANANLLPEPRLAVLVTKAEQATGRTYDCTGPWVSSKAMNQWACRSHDDLVVFAGFNDRSIVSIAVTWFGFDPRQTTLPAWAAASQTTQAGQAAADWAREQVGGVAATTLNGTSLLVGGSRGAWSLSVESR